MRSTRGLRALAAGALVAAVGASACAPAGSPQPGATTPATTPTPSPVASATPQAVDLTRPGKARDVLEQLQAAAGSNRIVQVEVTRWTAKIQILRGNDVIAWQWDRGVIDTVVSDVEYVGQAVFTLDDFELDDLGSLFRQAKLVSQSGNEQQLQVVDYNRGTVMMTVATEPESTSVFFHPDGTIVPEVDTADPESVALTLDEVVGDTDNVQLIEIQTTGIQADLPAGPDTVIRRTRLGRIPLLEAQRTESLDQRAFDPDLIDPEVIADLVATHEGTPLTISQEAGDRRPRIRVSGLTGTTVYTLNGEELPQG
ncbi:hypothetical protein [Parenemella sanctibonifatiensis]|uniref:hypothetical protein n=1 Tax=Parenemella sanctibonifatiensis TaxID=2016505 RepID=UPI00117F6BA1|nr:hypothetical protein [Parenemella sanctibonifatiensis]